MQHVRRILDNPRGTYAVLAPALVVCWFASGIGGGNGESSPSDGAAYYAGATGWALFCIVLLVTVIFSVVVLLRHLRRSPT